MKVALAQLNLTIGDLAGTAARILDAYRRACAQGAELVVFSELAVTGYPPRDLLLKGRFVPDNLATLDRIAREMTGAAAVLGYVDLNDSGMGRKFRNAAALIQEGRVCQRVWKALLPTYDVFDEDRYFEPAARTGPVTLGQTSLGITICEDIWNEEAFWRGRRERDGQPVYQRDPVRELCDAGAQVVVNLSASPYVLGKERLRHELLQTVARHHRRPLVFVNQVGGNDELIFD